VAAHLLNAPLRNVWLAVLGQARIHLQQQWNAAVYGVFRHKLASRYPFADKGSDATVADLADFFRPDSGVLWSFVEDNLSPFLSARRRRWSQRSWLGAGLDFSPAFINSLSRAGKITSGLFLRAKDEPQVQFAVYPIPSGGVRESMFGCNGQSFVYRNEPQEWQVFQWPGPESVQGSQVYAVASYGRTKAAVNCEGIWGLFHLLQRARVQQVAGGLLYSWELQTPEGRSLTVRFKLKPDRTANVFADGIFSRFRLPADLF